MFLKLVETSIDVEMVDDDEDDITDTLANDDAEVLPNSALNKFPILLPDFGSLKSVQNPRVKDSSGSVPQITPHNMEPNIIDFHTEDSRMEINLALALYGQDNGPLEIGCLI